MTEATSTGPPRRFRPLPVEGIVDLHAHVLPGVDDGPADAGEAAEVLAALAADGVTTVVATSHVSERYPNDAATLQAAWEQLPDVERPRVVLGAEIEPARLAEILEHGPAGYDLAGSGTLLLEAEPGIPVELLEAGRRRAAATGLKVLLGHAERSGGFQRHPAAVDRLVAAGAMVGVTAGALTGALGSESQRAAWALLERGAVHVVSSDVHPFRPPQLAAAEQLVAGRLGAEAADLLFRANPVSVLLGRAPTAVRPARAAGSLWRRLLATRDRERPKH